MSLTLTIPINGAERAAPLPQPLRVLELARECLGTPFRHQGRWPGIGLDCVGVVLHVWHGLGLPRYERADYGRSPNPRRMIAELDAHLECIAPGQAGVGDVYHMAWREQPQHLAILTPVGLLHAYAGAGQVIEHTIDDAWRARVRGAYRFPEAD